MVSDWWSPTSGVGRTGGSTSSEGRLLGDSGHLTTPRVRLGGCRRRPRDPEYDPSWKSTEKWFLQNFL